MKSQRNLFLAGWVFLVPILAGCAAPSDSIQYVEVTRLVEVTSTLIASTSEPTAAPLQPQDARTSSYMGGNESPLLADGNPGELSVIAVGTYNGNILPVVVRNNTQEDVIRVSISVTARAADGSLLAAGGDQGFNPNLVRSGEISLGYAYFGFDVDLPTDAQFEFEVSAKPVNGDFSEFENIRDLEVLEASLVDGRIVGMLRNAQPETVFGPIAASVICFDAASNLLSYHSDFTDKDQAASQDTIPFQVELGGDNACPIFLVAGSGFSR